MVSSGVLLRISLLANDIEHLCHVGLPFVFPLLSQLDFFLIFKLDCLILLFFEFLNIV